MVSNCTETREYPQVCGWSLARRERVQKPGESAEGLQGWSGDRRGTRQKGQSQGSETHWEHCAKPASVHSQNRKERKCEEKA